MPVRTVRRSLRPPASLWQCLSDAGRCLLNGRATHAPALHLVYIQLFSYRWTTLIFQQNIARTNLQQPARNKTKYGVFMYYVPPWNYVLFIYMYRVFYILFDHRRSN